MNPAPAKQQTTDLYPGITSFQFDPKVSEVLKSQGINPVALQQRFDRAVQGGNHSEKAQLLNQFVVWTDKVKGGNLTKNWLDSNRVKGDHELTKVNDSVSTGQAFMGSIWNGLVDTGVGLSNIAVAGHYMTKAGLGAMDMDGWKKANDGVEKFFDGYKTYVSQDYQKPLVSYSNENGVEFDLNFKSAVGTLGNLAAYMLPGLGIAKGVALAGKLGKVANAGKLAVGLTGATSFLQTFPLYQREALGNGLNIADATLFALPVAAINSVIETANVPSLSKALGISEEAVKGAIREVSQQEVSAALKGLAGKELTQEAFVESAKQATKNTLGVISRPAELKGFAQLMKSTGRRIGTGFKEQGISEGAEEFWQSIVENASKDIFNNLKGTEAGGRFEDPTFGNYAFDAIYGTLLGAVTGTGLGTLIQSKQFDPTIFGYVGADVRQSLRKGVNFDKLVNNDPTSNSRLKAFSILDNALQKGEIDSNQHQELTGKVTRMAEIARDFADVPDFTDNDRYVMYKVADSRNTVAGSNQQISELKNQYNAVSSAIQSGSLSLGDQIKAELQKGTIEKQLGGLVDTPSGQQFAEEIRQQQRGEALEDMVNQTIGQYTDPIKRQGIKDWFNDKLVNWQRTYSGKAEYSDTFKPTRQVEDPISGNTLVTDSSQRLFRKLVRQGGEVVTPAQVDENGQFIPSQRNPISDAYDSPLDTADEHIAVRQAIDDPQNPTQSTGYYQPDNSASANLLRDGNDILTDLIGLKASKQKGKKQALTNTQALAQAYLDSTGDLANDSKYGAAYSQLASQLINEAGLLTQEPIEDNGLNKESTNTEITPISTNESSPLDDIFNQDPQSANETTSDPNTEPTSNVTGQSRNVKSDYTQEVQRQVNAEQLQQIIDDAEQLAEESGEEPSESDVAAAQKLVDQLGQTNSQPLPGNATDATKPQQQSIDKNDSTSRKPRQSTLKEIWPSLSEDQQLEAKQIAESYLSDLRSPDDFTPEHWSIYQATGGTFKVKRASFVQYADENVVTMPIANTYFDSENGRGVDQIAEDANVSENDVIDYILTYPRGEDSVRSAIRKRYNEQFQKLTGKPLTKTSAEVVQDLASDLALPNGSELVSESSNLQADQVMSSLDEADMAIMQEIVGEYMAQYGDDWMLEIIQNPPSFPPIPESVENLIVQTVANATFDTQNTNYQNVRNYIQQTTGNTAASETGNSSPDRGTQTQPETQQLTPESLADAAAVIEQQANTLSDQSQQGLINSSNTNKQINKYPNNTLDSIANDGKSISGITVVEFSDNNQTVVYGKSNDRTILSVAGLNREDIQKEFDFENEIYESEKEKVSKLQEDLNSVKNSLTLSSDEKKDIITTINQSKKSLEIREKIVLPFLEYHLSLNNDNLKSAVQQQVQQVIEQADQLLPEVDKQINAEAATDPVTQDVTATYDAELATINLQISKLERENNSLVKQTSKRIQTGDLFAQQNTPAQQSDLFLDNTTGIDAENAAKAKIAQNNQQIDSLRQQAENVQQRKVKAIEQAVVAATQQTDLFAEPKPLSDAEKRIAEIRAKKAANTAKMMAKMRGSLNSGIDPEILTLGLENMALSVELGIIKFKEFVKDFINDLGVDSLSDNEVNTLKVVYGAYRTQAPKELRRQMDTDDDLDEITAEQINQLANTTTSGNDTGTINSLESNSSRGGVGQPMGSENVQSTDGRSIEQGTRQGIGSIGQQGLQSQSSIGIPENNAIINGESSDQSLYSSKSELQSSQTNAGDSEYRRGYINRYDGIQPERDGNTAVSATPSANSAKSTNEKLKQQAEADKIPVTYADRNNIDATLPYLYESQREDVHIAEQRFSKPDGYGMLFTNGTGTGKTMTALGAIKRFTKIGKSNVLIVVPNGPVMREWFQGAPMLGLTINKLENRKDSGKGISITTYANFAQNDAIAQHNYDLIVMDEAHKLMREKNANETQAIRTLRAISYHPNGYTELTNMKNRDIINKIADLREIRESNLKRMTNDDLMDVIYDELRNENKKIDEELRQLNSIYNQKLSENRQLVESNQQEKRPRVLFLSATPFAYPENIQWAHGYLFEYPNVPRTGRYNDPDPYQAFMIQRFGYRMRTGRLTEPEKGVDRQLMERQFNTWLKEQGSGSGRELKLDSDYQRIFALTPSSLGVKIDEGLNFLREQENANGKFHPLYELVEQRFDYFSKKRLLEAIKAKEAIPLIKQWHQLGKKVVIFYDLNKGGGFSPFRFDDIKDGQISYELYNKTVVNTTYHELIKEFYAARPDLAEINTGELGAPLDIIKEAFPQVKTYNGITPDKVRLKAIEDFNDDNKPEANLLMVQSDANEGWSGHDKTGKYPRVLINIGMPTAPTTAIQQEGRIYRSGQSADSNSMFVYLNTGTNWERFVFANTVAGRAGAAENMAKGENARGLRDAFIEAFESSEVYTPSIEEGKGGKVRDKELVQALTDFDKAKTLYYSQQKRNQNNKSYEGTDYFATPEPLGLKMVNWAGASLQPLEPSSGHGAIARWFSLEAKKTIIEPSYELFAKSSLFISRNDRAINERFEDYNIVNKHDVIVMNPPFGTAGKTASEHVEKAATKHLINGGRVVALVPVGSFNDKFNKWFYGTDEKGNQLHPELHLSARILLPSSTFERAGTKVNTQILVIDRVDNKTIRQGLSPTQTIDLTGIETTKELFDRIEELNVRERPSISTYGQPSAANSSMSERNGTLPSPQTATVQAALSTPTVQQPIKSFHAKNQHDIYVVQMNKRVDRSEYDRLNNLAKDKYDGYYSSFKGNGAVPGFVFRDQEKANQFTQEVNGVKDSDSKMNTNQAPENGSWFSIDGKLYPNIEQAQRVINDIRSRNSSIQTKIEVISPDANVSNIRYRADYYESNPTAPKFQLAPAMQANVVGTSALQQAIDRITSAIPSVRVITDISAFEQALRDTGAEQYLDGRRPKGFAWKGTVYLDPTQATPDTPLHEMGHLWLEAARGKNKDLYNRGVDLVRYSRYMDEVKADPFYSKLSETDQLEEALARAIGDKGAKYMLPSRRSTFSQFLNDLWSTIKKMLGIPSQINLENMTLDDFVKEAVGQMQNGSEGVQQIPRFDLPQIDTMGEYSQESTIKGEAVRTINQWRQIAEDAFKNPKSFISTLGADIAPRFTGVNPNIWSYRKPFRVANISMEDMVLDGDEFDYSQFEQDMINRLQQADMMARQAGRDGILSELIPIMKAAGVPIDTSENIASPEFIRKVYDVMLSVKNEGTKERGSEKFLTAIDKEFIKEVEKQTGWKLVGPETIVYDKDSPKKYHPRGYYAGGNTLVRLPGYKINQAMERFGSLYNDQTNRGKTFRFMVDRMSRWANLDTFINWIDDEAGTFKELFTNIRREAQRNADFVGNILEAKGEKLKTAMAPFSRMWAGEQAKTVDIKTYDVEGGEVVTKTVTIPVANAMAMIRQAETQKSSRYSKQTAVWQSEPKLTQLAEQNPDGTFRRIPSGAVWYDELNDKTYYLNISENTFNELKNRFETGLGAYTGEIAAYQALKEYFNDQQVKDTVRSESELLRPDEEFMEVEDYFPLQSFESGDARAQSRNATRTLDQNRRLLQRTGASRALLLRDPLIEASSYASSIRDVLAYARLVDNLNNLQTQLDNDYDGPQSQKLQNYIKSIASDLKDRRAKIAQRNAEGGLAPTMDKVMQKFVQSVFGFNIGLPLKQVSTYAAAYGQGIIGDNFLKSSTALGTLARLSKSAYLNWDAPSDIDPTTGRGFVGTLTGMETGDAELMKELLGMNITDPAEKEAYQKQAATLIARITYRQTLATGDVEFKETDLTNLPTKTQQVLKKIDEFQNRYGLSAMRRADAAVILSYYVAAKQHASAEGLIEGTPEFRSRVIELTEGVTYTTNMMGQLADMTPMQRSMDWITKALGLFSGQQQKILNLIMGRLSDWAKTGTELDAIKLAHAVGWGVFANALWVSLVSAGASALMALLSGREPNDEWETQLGFDFVRNVTGTVPGMGSAAAEYFISLNDTYYGADNIGSYPPIEMLQQSIDTINNAKNSFLEEDEKTRERSRDSAINGTVDILTKVTGLPASAVKILKGLF